MTKRDLLDELLRKQNGILHTAEVRKAGVSRQYFADYVKEKMLERVAHGIYLAPDAWCDGFYLLQLRWPQAVFSHEAALYLWRLVDREPMPFTVTVRSGYNASNLTADGIKVYKIKPELYELGKTEIDSPGGHRIVAYDRERSLCDLFRSRSQVEIQDQHTAMREYVQSKEKNIPLLLRYAKALRVERVLKPYLEAVLP